MTSTTYTSGRWREKPMSSQRMWCWMRRHSKVLNRPNMQSRKRSRNITSSTQQSSWNTKITAQAQYAKTGTKSAHNPPGNSSSPRKTRFLPPAKQHQKATSNSNFNINMPARFIYLPKETVSLQGVSCRITIFP